MHCISCVTRLASLRSSYEVSSCLCLLLASKVPRQESSRHQAGLIVRYDGTQNKSRLQVWPEAQVTRAGGGGGGDKEPLFLLFLLVVTFRRMCSYERFLLFCWLFVWLIFPQRRHGYTCTLQQSHNVNKCRSRDGKKKNNVIRPFHVKKKGILASRHS